MNTALFTSDQNTALPLARLSVQAKTTGTVARIVLTQVFSLSGNFEIGGDWDDDVRRAVADSLGRRLWKSGYLYVIPLDCFPNTQEMVIEVDGVEYGTEILQVEVPVADPLELNQQANGNMNTNKKQRRGVVPSREYDIDLRSVMQLETDSTSQAVHGGLDQEHEHEQTNSLDMSTLSLYKSFAEYALEWSGRWNGWGGQSSTRPRVVEIGYSCIPFNVVSEKKHSIVVRTVFLQTLTKRGASLICHIPLSALGNLTCDSDTDVDVDSELDIQGQPNSKSKSRERAVYGSPFSILPLDVCIDVRSPTLRHDVTKEVRCFTHDVLSWSFRESGRQLVQLSLDEGESGGDGDGKGLKSESKSKSQTGKMKQMMVDSYELANDAMQSDFIVVIPLSPDSVRDDGVAGRRSDMSIGDIVKAILFVGAIFYFIWLAKGGGWSTYSND